METIQGLENVQRNFPNLVLTLGSFDGMHLGHRKVVRKAVKRAGEIKGTSMVLTFHPHPRRVVNKNSALSLLTTTEQKLKLVSHLGVDVCLVINFDKNFSRISPRKFIVKVLHQRLNVKEIFVGSDYLFGRGQAGNMDFLLRMGKECGFRINKVKDVRRKGEVVSSTRIRQLIQKGELDLAGELLGRPYSIWGRVKKGSRKAYLTGYPTANLGSREEVLPPAGAYVAWIRLDKEIYPGIAGIVEKGKERVVEAHLFNFNGNLYDLNIEVVFGEMIRGKKCFSHREEAKRQLAADEEIARKLVSRFPFTKFKFHAKLSSI